jgi:hypothetical protein
MDFKEYYHNRLNEDGTINEPLDADAPVKEAPQAQPTQTTGGAGIITPYVSNTTLKLGLRKLGEDIGMAIVEYATKQAVQPTDFKSEDDYIKYTQDIRKAIAEKSNVAVRDMLSNIGLYIDNAIHNSCPNK